MNSVMSALQPDIEVRVRLLTPEEGGRRTPIVGASYGCPLFFDGSGFDCRIVNDHQLNLTLGETHYLALQFLNPDLVLPRLNEGAKITLWEGKTIAEGEVTKVF